MDRFVAAINNRFDAIDSRLQAITAGLNGHEVILKKIIDDLEQLKGACARKAVLASAAIVARELGLLRTKALAREELLDLIDAADTANISVDDLISFRVADLNMEATAEDGEICYVVVEISYTANGNDLKRALRIAEFMTRFTGKRSFAVVSGLNRDDRIHDRIESSEVFWHQLMPEQIDAE